MSNVGTTFDWLTKEELKITAPDREIVLVPTLAKTSSSISQKQFLYWPKVVPLPAESSTLTRMEEDRMHFSEVIYN